jgi:hypothetical protein
VGHASGLILGAVLVSAPVRADTDFVPERVQLRLASELGVSDGATDSLALDGWYDVNARFRIGITTSTDARHELGSGRGLCLHDCAHTFAGLAGEAQIRIGTGVIGRAAIDTSRFAPTAAAVELGIDALYTTGGYALLVAPVLRMGIARRDLSNGNTAALFVRGTAQLWSNGGVLAIARGGLDLGALRQTPSFGAAGGMYLLLGAFTITARFGVEAVSNDRLFGELALGWSS